MKRLIFLLSICLLAVASCTGSGDKSKSSSSMESNSENSEVADFVHKALSGGMMEVELGEAAQTQALGTRVKNFGKMMVADHTQAGEELKALAASKNISLPENIGEEHRDHITSLKKKSGVNFDKAYLKMMLSDHKKDVKMFEKAAKNSKDADLRALAAKLLPTLKKHLDSAKSINKNVRVSLDPSDMTNGVETFPQR